MKGASSRHNLHRREWILLIIAFAVVPSCTRTGPSATPTPPEVDATQGVASSISAPAEPTVLHPSTSPSPAATPDIVATIAASQEPTLRSTHSSPDGARLAQAFSYPCTGIGAEEEYAYDFLQIADVQQDTRQIVASQLLTCGGLGAAGIEGLFWSPGGRFFYYTDAASGVPDGCGYWSPPVLRVDTTSWSSEALGNGPISPDGTKIATWRGDELALWEVSGSKIGSARSPLTGAILGPIAWAPDGSSVAFLLSSDYCPLGETHVMVTDLSTLVPTLLVSSQDPSFADVRWLSQDRIELLDESGNSWIYAVSTGTLSPASP